MAVRLEGVVIEVIGACNLRCPSCPNGNSPDIESPAGIMSAGRFEEILEKVASDVSYFDTVYLYNWGEPFLHPDLPRLVELVKRRGWKCALSSNLNAWRNVDEVLRAKPDRLVVTLSGYSQAVYEMTHAGGNAETVISNMRKLRESMQRLRSDTRVAVRYLTYTHNTGEDFARVEDLCRKLRFDFNPGWAFVAPVSTLLNYYCGEEISGNAQRALGLLAIKPEEARALQSEGRSSTCSLQSGQLAINCDGSVHLCCGAWGNDFVIAPDYLDVKLVHLLDERLSHPLCAQCMSCGIPDYFTYSRPEELDRIAADRLTTIGKTVRSLHRYGGFRLAQIPVKLDSAWRRITAGRSTRP